MSKSDPTFNNIVLFDVVIDKYRLISKSKKNHYVDTFEQVITTLRVLKKELEGLYKEYNESFFEEFSTLLSKYNFPKRIVLNNRRFEKYFSLVLPHVKVRNYDYIALLKEKVSKLKFTDVEIPHWLSNDFFEEINFKEAFDEIIKLANDLEINLNEAIYCYLFEIQKRDELILKKLNNRYYEDLFYLLKEKNLFNINHIEKLLRYVYNVNTGKLFNSKIISLFSKYERNEIINALVELYYLYCLEPVFPDKVNTIIKQYPSDKLKAFELLLNENYNFSQLLVFNHDYLDRYLINIRKELSEMNYLEKSNIIDVKIQEIKKQLSCNIILELLPKSILDKFTFELACNIILYFMIETPFINDEIIAFKQRIKEYLLENIEEHQTYQFREKNLIDAIKRLLQHIELIYNLRKFEEAEINFNYLTIDAWKEYYHQFFLKFSSLLDKFVLPNKQDNFRIFYFSNILNTAYSNFEEKLLEKYEKIQSNFEEFILKNYPTIISDKTIKTVKDVKEKLLSILRNEKKRRVYLLILDGMSFSSWNLLKNIFSNFSFQIKEETFFSVIPTITEVARRVLFGGNYFNILCEQYSNPRDEKNLLINCFRETKYPVCYTKAINEFRENITKNYKVISYIINDFDEYAHIKRKIPLNVREAMIDEVRVHLQNFLEIIIDYGFTNEDVIIITTDHGMQRVYNKNINVPEVDKNIYLEEFTSGRIKMYLGGREFFNQRKTDRLIDFSKIENTYYIGYSKLNDFRFPRRYLKGKRFFDVLHLLIAKTSFAFTWQRAPYTHGGISMEELFIPFITITKSIERDKRPIINVEYKKRFYQDEVAFLHIDVHNITDTIIELKSIKFNEVIIKSINRVLDTNQKICEKIRIDTKNVKSYSIDIEVVYKKSGLDKGYKTTIEYEVLRRRSSVVRSWDDKLK